MSLHDELARIAERAPVADVAPDTFARGRRARRRDRGLALAASAAVVAVLVGLVAGVPQRLDPPVADSGSLGVPDHLYGVPERMDDRRSDGSWMREEVRSDLAVGRAAAAWVTEQGLPAVVGAADGAYHLLDLPDYAGNNPFLGLYEPTVTLSPDGRQLAYSWATFGPDAATEPIPSGIRVVDLETGDVVREVPLPGAEGTLVTRLVWSPDGRWLGWTGARLASWTRASMGGGTPVAGRVPPGSAVSGTVRAPREDAGLAIDNGGRLSLLADGRRLLWDGARTTRTPLRARGLTGRTAVLPGGHLAFSVDAGFTVVLVDDDGESVALDASGDLSVVAGGDAEVVGAVDDRVLVRSRPLDLAAGALLLLDRDGRSEEVGVVDPDVPDTLTIATDLMTLDRPTVERPEPDWPWSEERWVAMIGAGLAAVLVLWVGLARLRRRLV